MKLMIAMVVAAFCACHVVGHDLTGTQWQTISESEWQERLSFEKDFVVLETRSFDTESLEKKCVHTKGKFNWNGDTLIIAINNNEGKFVMDMSAYAKKYGKDQNIPALVLLSSEISEWKNSFLFFNIGKNKAFAEAWETLDCNGSED